MLMFAKDRREADDGTGRFFCGGLSDILAAIERLEVGGAYGEGDEIASARISTCWQNHLFKTASLVIPKD